MMFHDCCERHWDGSELPAKHGKNRVVRSWYYSQREWPDEGGVMTQDNRIVEIFGIIKDESARILASKVK